jgi:hypothetical protein
MHSEECLNFLPRYLRQIPGISRIIDGLERGPQPIDFNRSWWTPPLSPASALRLKQDQIGAMGFRPLVSLTDHDNIGAGISLQAAAGPEQSPVSVEWAVPYDRTILHIGVHNLPPGSARGWMSVLAEYTAKPDERVLPAVLSELAKIPEVLIVLNHSFWLEEDIAELHHRWALERVLRGCIEWFRAFELNGTRPWKESAAVIELARTHGLPLVSGSDRHGAEPAACLNFTDAGTFSEFVSQIRGHSSVWFMPQYSEPMVLRVLETARDVMRRYPEYTARKRWTDRFFYRGDDGIVRSLSAVWQDHVPLVPSVAAGILQLCGVTSLRPGAPPPSRATRRDSPLNAVTRRYLISFAGLSPQTIALVVAVGFDLGVFPIFGVPTILCALAAVILRLSLPAIQLMNQLSSPFQFALLIPLTRLGARILGEHAAWNVAVATRSALVGWFCLCVPVGLIVYFLVLILLRRRRWQWFNGLENSA